jgi:hypothetical protein
VGDFARAFFTGEDTPVILELLFVNQNRQRCLHSWASLLAIDAADILKISYTRLLGRYRVRNHEVSFSKKVSFPVPEDRPKGNEDKCIVSCVYKYRLKGSSGRLSFFELAFLEDGPMDTIESSLFPQNRVSVSVHSADRCNYISWNTAFCPSPLLLSIVGFLDGYHREPSTCYGQCRQPSSLIHHSRPWTVCLPLQVDTLQVDLDFHEDDKT